ncbi:MAG: efflux RND transporter periplasmic adaptor subunit [Gammaproteobacteria bacterium]|nr:efflux RND transporter periplasmic adaptor subunit [Gammaproteobacteria bacterium]
MGKVGPSNVITISPKRLQSIGVTYEKVQSHKIDKIIRTVGRVEADERLLANIHVKFEGWIDKLFVNYTGEKVKKGQPLFSVYSPELVATQQEFLLALRARSVLGAQSAEDAAYQRLRFWDVPSQEIQRLTRTGKASKTITIYSPISGTVLEKTALQGMRIVPDNKLYTIADLSHLWILADIYEYELPFIRKGQEAQITLTYLPQKIFKAKIIFIDPVVNMQTRTVRVRFETENRDNQLKPGMYSNVELKIPLGNRLVVPKDAIIITGERAIVFIYHGNGKLEWRTVKLGVRSGDNIEILQGIKVGEVIITSANFLIDSESQLKAAMGGMQH